jgi:hypothetical protein
MRQYLVGLAAAMAVAAVSAPAMAGCGGCAPVVSYSSCAQPVSASPCGGYGYGGGWGYATLPAPVRYYSVQPQYYYVNQGPTYTGPGMFAPAVSYQQRAVGGWSGYGVGRYGYSGGPYAHPSHHYYHGMPAVSTPTVYSYRRVYRPRYSAYAPRVYRGPRYHYAPRVYRGPRVWAPSVRYGYRKHVAPRHVGPRHRMMPHHYK